MELFGENRFILTIAVLLSSSAYLLTAGVDEYGSLKK